MSIKVIVDLAALLGVSEAIAGAIFEKANVGGEVAACGGPDAWLKDRLRPNLVWIKSEEYARMCAEALPVALKTVASDFGGARQRDFAQLWADTTRGYLGEFALKKHLDSLGCQVQLAHKVGELKEFLKLDIHLVKKDGEPERVPKVNIGIKTTKWNGIWLDIPGAQFSHSNFHTFVKVGVGKDHLIAFFKDLSVFKDKVLKKGVEVGAFTLAEADNIYDNLPTFQKIPAYICGFVDVTDFQRPEPEYDGKVGRKHYIVSKWAGPYSEDLLKAAGKTKNISGVAKLEGIQKLNHAGYLFNAGSLKWKKADWDILIAAL
jgi:hypothetical protein